MKQILSIGEILIIVIVAIAPVFATFPYRLNIFLSWEGAYRLYLGQLPYKDFGMPVGYMYWVVPAMFFKIFGPQLFTLIKAQSFINILSGLAFRSIFKSLEVQPAIRFTGVLVFTLSYSFFNYWPWYNHTVIVYELIALAFLLKHIFRHGKWGNIWLILAGVFAFFSFFTKQDAGGLGLLLCLALLIYHSIIEKKWLPILLFVTSALITGVLMMAPFLRYDFSYWFNYGQSPHSSRISIGDIFKEFFSASQWLKFYLLILAIILSFTTKSIKEFWSDKRQVIFTLLTLGIFAEAAVFQVTSYVPVDNNVFFHAFAFCYIIFLLSHVVPGNFNSWKMVIICTVGVLLWWSSVYWRYVERFILQPGSHSYTYTTYEGNKYANVIDRNTYMLTADTADIPLNEWRIPNLKSFDRILLPNATVDGIERLMNMDLVKNGKNLKVLNMSELTPLAAEVPFTLESGSHYPLWYHKGVAMFQKETNMFVDRIQNKYYDLVLFEYIPYLNNFYPFEVRAALKANYRQVDVFTAPRKPSSDALVEVYVR